MKLSKVVCMFFIFVAVSGCGIVHRNGVPTSQHVVRLQVVSRTYVVQGSVTEVVKNSDKLEYITLRIDKNIKGNSPDTSINDPFKIGSIVIFRVDQKITPNLIIHPQKGDKSIIYVSQMAQNGGSPMWFIDINRYYFMQQGAYKNLEGQLLSVH